MTVLISNNAVGTLASSINDTVQTIALGSGQGALFPSPAAGQFFYATIIRTSDSAREIVKCTSRATDTLTVDRAQDGTTAKSFSASDRIELRFTKAVHDEYAQKNDPNTFTEDQTISALLTATDITVTDDLVVGDDASVAGDLTVTGSILMSSRKVDAFPTGTLMLFQQTSAPTGWTKETTHNDKALRVVSGTASSGGTTAFSSVFAARTIARANLPNVTLTFSGTTSTDGAHTHSTSAGYNGGGGENGSNNPEVTASGTTSSSGSHSHTVSGNTSSINGGVTQTTMDFAVQYVDLIIASKDA